MSDTHIKNKKQALRGEMRVMLQMLPIERRAQASVDICQAIIEMLRASPTIKTVASFIALPSEPDLACLHTHLPNIRLVYPHSLTGGEMHFHQVSEIDDLETGFYNIPQPPNDPQTLVAPSEIDAFLCPGFAFTEAGQRLGKGGGYYDRMLSQRSASSRLIGICFCDQIVPSLPTEEHDIQVEQVISA